MQQDDPWIWWNLPGQFTFELRYDLRELSHYSWENYTMPSVADYTSDAAVQIIIFFLSKCSQEKLEYCTNKRTEVFY